MKFKIALLIFLASLAAARADDTVSQAQQALKDQGFYYGEVTGEKNADTTAAIRRYQIRNGLQVTGELNSETMRSLANTPREPASPVTKEPEPRANPTPFVEDESGGEAQPQPAPRQPFTGPPDNGASRRGPDTFPNGPEAPPVYPSNPNPVVPVGRGPLAGTPYETAPPPVQRDLIASAQRVLARKDIYKGDVDGIYGPGLEFSLRAYQSRVGLQVTGRLDLETLAALNLLPGARVAPYGPRRPIVRPRPDAPVRGEWIRE